MAIISFSTSSSSSEDDLVLKRIQAKADLWAFVNEVSPDIISWKCSLEEYINEIAAISIRILYPAFKAQEMTEEIINVLITLKIEIPKHFQSKILDQVLEIVISKIPK